MKLFGKKEKGKTNCFDKNSIEKTRQNTEHIKSEKEIKILGSGCAKCIALENLVQKAIEELGLDFKIEHITDFVDIASYGVMSTPALVINGKVVSCGKMLSIDEIKKILDENI